MATPLSGRRLWPLLCLTLFSAGISPGEEGDQPAYTLHSHTSEVRLSFSATDQDNHGVATLKASDFAVVDREIIVRDFQSFDRTDWTKMEIAILVDTSESVTPRLRQEIVDTLDIVSRTAGVPDENLSVFSFQGTKPALVCAGDCRAARAADRLPSTHAGGLTPLFDSIVYAADFLGQRGQGRAVKILIVFSDGDDTISRNSLRDAIEAAANTEVQIYAVDLGSTASNGTQVLYSLAAATGGRCFPERTGARRALDTILEDFRATYTVSYRLPSHASGFHPVRILPTHNLNLQFRSRSGYYYPNHTW